MGFATKPPEWSTWSPISYCWHGWTRAARWNGDPVELVSLCAEAVHTAATVGPDWPVTFESPRPIEVMGDATGLRQVVDNLLGNVRAHTPPGTTTRVSVDERRGRRGHHRLRRRSRDGPEEAEHVFERFYRADPSRSRVPTEGPASGSRSSVPSSPPTGERWKPTAASDGGATFIVHLPTVPTTDQPTPGQGDQAVGDAPAAASADASRRWGWTRPTVSRILIAITGGTHPSPNPTSKSRSHERHPTHPHPPGYPLDNADVEIVVPVYNEEGPLADSITTLRTFLDTSFPFVARITIADNASTDGTWRIATRLSDTLSGVSAIHLDEKGRGRALRAAWTRSTATVVSYMDVDLATGLDALLPLVAPLLSGHSDVAIGTRLGFRCPCGSGHPT